MIDRGLLLSAVAVAAVTWALARLARPRTLAADDLIDACIAPLFTGLLAGRLTAMALDDPSGIRRLGDILIVRGGVEFWPGVAVGAAMLGLGARRQHIPIHRRLADVAPYGLAAYAAYEATCVVRDGCFGPVSAFGIAPGGVGERQFPVGVAVALTVAALGVAVYQLIRRAPGWSLLVSIGGLAAVRYVAAFWLPRIGPGLTRPQLESLAVVLGTAAVGLVSFSAGRTLKRKMDGVENVETSTDRNGSTAVDGGAPPGDAL